MLTRRYDRADGRGAWSVYIKKEPAEAPSSDSHMYQNFKLAPKSDSYFTARIVKEQNVFSPELMLDKTDVDLLEEVYRLFQ